MTGGTRIPRHRGSCPLCARIGPSPQHQDAMRNAWCAAIPFHNLRALLTRARGQPQTQDFPPASGPRRGGCAPAAARREGQDGHTSPARRGSASMQGQEDAVRQHLPRTTGVDPRTNSTRSCTQCRPRTDGGTPPGPAPGVRTPGRDTPPPGAMRNLRVPENADSGDWWQRVEHPPAGRFCLAGLNHGKRAPARSRSTAPRRRPDTRPRQGVSK